MKILKGIEKSHTLSVAVGFVIGLSVFNLLSTFAQGIVNPVVSSIFGDAEISTKTAVLVDPVPLESAGINLAWGQLIESAISVAVIIGVTLGIVYLASNGVPKKSGSKKK